MLAFQEKLETWAHASPADDFWPLTIGLAIGALICFISGFTYFYRKRIIQDTPTSKIRSAAQGYVEISGHSQLIEGDRITGPLTDKTCVWYTYQIEKKKRSGKRTHWVTVEKGTSESMFMILDETGEMLVDPEGAVVTPIHSDIWYGHTPRPETMSPGNNKKFFGIGNYRYTEKRLHPDDTLYALGLFKSTGGHHTKFNLNHDVRDLISEWKSNSQSLLENYDKNRDGTIDLEEWEAVREAALQSVLSQHEEIRSMPPVNIIGKTCDKRRPYLLSAYPQSVTISKYNRYSCLLLSIFFIAGMISTWLLSVRLSG